MSKTDRVPLDDRDQERWRELHELPFDDLTDAEKTSKIRLSVKRRFNPPEWVLMFEYGAPGNDGRVCDCLAVNTLPSRNYKVVGFEFKASRSDWLREVRDGRKADYFVRLADEFYIVAPKGVVQESEIPDGWGYLELKPNSEQLYKLQDSDLTEHQQGEPGRRFWVRFLKQTVGEDSNYSEQDLVEARSRGYEAAKDDKFTQNQLDRDLKRLRQKAERWDQLQDSPLGFLPNYGFDKEDTRTLELAWQIVRAVRSNRFGSPRSAIDRLQDDIERHTDQMLESVAEIEGGIENLVDRVETGDAPEFDGPDPLDGGDDA